MSTLPPAGWFDDPENPGFLRYWDGGQWTEHRSPSGGASVGTLTDVGTWLSQTFSDVWVARTPLAALGAMLLAAWAVAGGVASWAVTGLVYVGGAWQGVDGGRIATAVLVAGVVSLISLVLYLAVVHQLHAVRGGEPARLPRSLRAAFVATPRAIGWMLLLAVAAVVTMVALALLVALVGPIGLLLVFALVFGGAWAWVKLSFLLVACVAPVSGLNAVKASAEVSNGGRFWAVLGRIILLAVIATVVSLALSIPLNALGAAGSDFDQILVTDDDGGLVFFDVGKFVDEVGLGGGVLMLVTSLPQMISSVLSISGATNIYSQVHGRRQR